MGSARLSLEPWSHDDLPLLQAINAPEMTQHLGGPETDEKLIERLARYVAARDSSARMFRILVDGIDGPVGSIGYWERQWHGDTVYETGWSVLPPYQGRGIATAAISQCLEEARAEGTRTCAHAFPRVENLASNAICQKSGFSLVGECDFEYPAGNPIRCNDWSYDLVRAPAIPSRRVRHGGLEAAVDPRWERRHSPQSRPTGMTKWCAAMRIPCLK